jgi:hypothetical protein
LNFPSHLYLLGFPLIVNMTRVELSLKDKKEILDMIDRRVRYDEIATRFKCTKGTISGVKKSRDVIKARIEQGCDMVGTQVSRLRDDPAELDRRILDWFRAARGRGLPITGRLIQESAIRAAANMGMFNFKGSNGWLMRFQKRHQIAFRTISGEAQDMDPGVVANWKVAIGQLIGGYALRDVYNCDETGLFFRGLPDKTLAERGEQCKGGKLAKQRVTILFTASAEGEKEPPFVIWSSMMPRCFNKKVPEGIMWRSNKKAWMTSGNHNN